MPSLLNPYLEFFHCAGEEFQYEMDVANEVVDSSKATIMMVPSSTSTSNRRYAAPTTIAIGRTTSRTTAAAAAARPEWMRSDSDSIVGCPPSPSPSVELLHDHSPPQQQQQAAAGGVTPDASHHHHQHMHKTCRS